MQMAAHSWAPGKIQDRGPKMLSVLFFLKRYPENVKIWNIIKANHKMFRMI